MNTSMSLARSMTCLEKIWKNKKGRSQGAGASSFIEASRSSRQRWTSTKCSKNAQALPVQRNRLWMLLNWCNNRLALSPLTSPNSILQLSKAAVSREFWLRLRESDKFLMADQVSRPKRNRSNHVLMRSTQMREMQSTLIKTVEQASKWHAILSICWWMLRRIAKSLIAALITSLYQYLKYYTRKSQYHSSQDNLSLNIEAGSLCRVKSAPAEAFEASRLRHFHILI